MASFFCFRGGQTAGQTSTNSERRLHDSTEKTVTASRQPSGLLWETRDAECNMGTADLHCKFGPVFTLNELKRHRARSRSPRGQAKRVRVNAISAQPRSLALADVPQSWPGKGRKGDSKKGKAAKGDGKIGAPSSGSGGSGPSSPSGFRRPDIFQ